MMILPPLKKLCRGILLLAIVLPVFAETAPPAQEKATAAPKSNWHYFEQVNSIGVKEVEDRMTKRDVRYLCGGKEYAPLETLKDGSLTIAANSEHSVFFTVPDFKHSPEDHIDFFFAGKSLLVVYYMPKLKGHGLQVYHAVCYNSPPKSADGK